MGRKAILISEGVTDSERRLTAILDFFGVRWERVGLNALWDFVPATGDCGYCVFSAMDVARRAFKARSDAASFPPLLRNAHSVFFFGSEDFEADRGLLQSLTEDAAVNLHAVQASEVLCSVSNECTEVCGPLSGLPIRIPVASTHITRFIRRDRRFVPLISAEEGYLFAAIDLEKTRCFIAPSPALVDISLPVEKGYFDVADYFCSAVPVVMYLRYAFRDAIPAPPDIGACLIVDDPVLRRQYGFFDFEKVSALSLEHRFTCNIAFIPWNWRRSQRSVIELFKRNAGRMSLSIHGCDHSAREFGGSSASFLNSQAKLAIRRMELHRQLTGLPYDPLMVFPQGCFSPVAPIALKHGGFIAAVNTEVSPVGPSVGTEIREVWRTAILKYGDFAIFTRRYSFHGLHNFAFDLMLGKPCLVVTHHSDFHDEGRGLMDFIDRLNSLRTPLAWRSLGDVVRRAYEQRLRNDGVLHIRMFGGEIVVENSEPVSRHIAVEKSEHDPEGLDRVEVDGQKIAFAHDESYAKFELDLSPRQRALIRVVPRDLNGEVQTHGSVKRSTKLLFRRCLSEFRDEAQARAPWIYKSAQNVRGWVSRGGVGAREEALKQSKIDN